MDSIKLFFLNVFLFILFLEAYIIAFMFQNRYGIELPFLTLFMSGVFSFIAITVWVNVAHVWYHNLKAHKKMLIRAVTSELPFIFLLLILSLVGKHASRGITHSSDVRDLLMLFTGYMIIFPAVMVLAKSHKQKIESMK